MIARTGASEWFFAFAFSSRLWFLVVLERSRGEVDGDRSGRQQGACRRGRVPAPGRAPSGPGPAGLRSRPQDLGRHRGRHPDPRLGAGRLRRQEGVGGRPPGGAAITEASCFKLEQARLRLGASGSPEVDELLRQVTKDLSAEVTSLRRTIGRLRPLVLVEDGLEAALREGLAT
jgi:hypothetical protein